MELLAQNSAIEKEIEVFEQYAAKFNIQDLLPASVDFIEKLSSRRKKRNLESKKEKLKIQQKIEIVGKIIDETNKTINALEQAKNSQK